MEPPGIDWDCLPGGTQVTGMQKWEPAASGGGGGFSWDPSRPSVPVQAEHRAHLPDQGPKGPEALLSLFFRSSTSGPGATGPAGGWLLDWALGSHLPVHPECRGPKG